MGCNRSPSAFPLPAVPGAYARRMVKTVLLRTVAVALALASAGPSFAQQKTPAQLTQATSVASGDLMLVWPTAANGPLKSIQWSVLESVMQTALGNQYLQVNNNLSDVASPSIARGNLGLGGSATLNVGQVAGTVMAGNDSRVAGACQMTGCAFTGGVTGTSGLFSNNLGINSNFEMIVSSGTPLIEFNSSSAYLSYTPGTGVYNFTLSGTSLFSVGPSGATIAPVLSGTFSGSLTGNVTGNVSGTSGGVVAGGVTTSMLASGAAVGNIGYTPVNKAGDTMSAALNFSGPGCGVGPGLTCGYYLDSNNVVVAPTSSSGTIFFENFGHSTSWASLSASGFGLTVAPSYNSNPVAFIGASATGSGSISYGTSAPGTLAVNQIYLQTN